MSMSQQTISFRPEEFQMLKTTIGNYLEYLDRMVPPSTERDRLLSVLQGVYVRLKQFLALGQKREGQCLWLTEAEVTAIDMGLVTFARLVPLVTQPSPEQEDAVLEFGKMRWRVRSLLPRPLH